MPANNALQITGTDFDDIKSNLKSFLSSQTKFTDYNFEDSTIGLLVDLLSYNTYYNAVYLNQVANEMYLDSALLRSNVVSRAKMLGYTPNSAKGSTATVKLVFSPNDSRESVGIPRNTIFTSAIDGIDYNFCTTTSYIANTGSSYTINVDLTEGTPLTHRYTVDTTTNQRFTLPNHNVDTNKILVNVQQSSSNSAVTSYIRATDLTQVKNTSAIYFLQENLDGEFELVFGDGILGKKLSDGNVIKIEYYVNNGSDTNKANVFVAPASINGISTFTVSTVSTASGGANLESIDSVKFNAPKNYTTQNRAVTAEDYKRIILAENSDLLAVRTWGGEENTPPVYGRVYISTHPALSTSRQETLTTFLEKRNVMSIDPVFADPAYLYIVPSIDVRYNPDITTTTATEISNKISAALLAFETSELGLFETHLYKSKLIAKLAAADQSIMSASLDFSMQKRFRPNTTLKTTYKISFHNAVKHPTSGIFIAVSSSKFTYLGKSTSYFDDDGVGNIRIFYMDGATKIYLNHTAGTIEYDTGFITLTDLVIAAYDGDDLKLNVIPSKHDLFTVRNQIPLIADSSITITDDVLSKIVFSVSNVTTTLGTTTPVAETGVNTVVI
jgi:hypothetical protein